jgi:carbamoyl-phosphate synthase large subunit
MSAPCVLGNLHNIEEAKIFGTDIYPPEWQTNLGYLEKFYRVPKYNERDYIDSIMEICLKNNIRFIFPLTDPEIDVLNQNRNIFEGREITICISSFEAILRCRDKSKIGSNIPFFSQNELQNIAVYPIIAKPKNGRSSDGKLMLENPTQLSAIKNADDYIFQPYIDGQVVTADVIRDKDGNMAFISRKEHIRTSNGAGIVVEIFEDIKLEEIIFKIATELNILGCVNIEFLHCKEAYYLMDVNPRFSAGVGFSCAAGYNFIKEHLNVFQNKKISELQKIEIGILANKSEIIQIGGFK